MSQTGELELSISDLSAHLRGISDELAAERKARLEEKARGVSILNMHVPLPVVLALFGGLASIAIATGLYIHQVSGHLANSTIHVDAEKALKGDGVAYVRDVRSEMDSRISDLEATIRRNATAIRSGANCRVKKGSPQTWTCEFTDPDVIPLRGGRVSQ